MNVADECDKWSMDWSDIKEWQENHPNDADVLFGFSGNTYDKVFITSKEQDVDEFQQAKMEELDKRRKFNVYQEVTDNGQKRVTGRWVCTRKVTEDGFQPKARYVVRGF